jgi:hypothetical protein
MPRLPPCIHQGNGGGQVKTFSFHWWECSVCHDPVECWCPSPDDHSEQALCEGCKKKEEIPTE